MANGDDHSNKSSGAVWDRLNQQSDFISELARSQAATEANLAALAQSVASGFDSINGSLNRIIERENRPTNWIGLGSLLVVVVGGLLTFVALQTDPVRIRATENTEELNAALDREIEYAEERGRMKAQIDYLDKEIRLIDEWGSRRWIRSTGED
jgi:hypothetical protein